MSIHIENGKDTVYVINSGHFFMGTCRDNGPPPTSDSTTVPPGPPNPLPPGNPCNGTAGKITAKVNSTGNQDQASIPSGTASYFACIDDPETEGDECDIDVGGEID
jgi:hypothetical protein